MTVGDTLIAFGLLAIVMVLTCETCWRARFPRWHNAKSGWVAKSDWQNGRVRQPFRNALGGAHTTTRVEGQQGK
jgi:hypothetical protein